MKIGFVVLMAVIVATAVYFNNRIGALDRQIQSMELITAGVPVEYLNQHDYTYSEQQITYLGREAALRIYRSPGHHYDFAAIINEEGIVEAAFPIAANFPDAEALRRLQGE